MHSSTRQRDLNRGRVCLFGVGCAPPANPLCQTVVVGPFTTPVPPTGQPASTGLINALCAVQLNLVGCGFFPNETTIICQGFATETGVPLQRPGKTVTTAASLACDTNGDGIAEATIALGSGDAVELQPGEGDVESASDEARDSVPGCVLRRTGDDNGDDDVHGRGQQHLRTVHADDDVFVEPGNESAGGVQRDAVRRELRDPAGSADLGSVLHSQRRTERNVGVCGGSSEPGDVIQRDGVRDIEPEPDRRAVQLRVRSREDVLDLRDGPGGRSRNLAVRPTGGTPPGVRWVTSRESR